MYAIMIINANRFVFGAAKRVSVRRAPLIVAVVDSFA